MTSTSDRGLSLDDAGRQRWLGAALLVGALYLAAGVGLGAVAGAAGSIPMRNFWRVSAFVVCGVVFAAHVAHEHLRRRHTTWPTAWHAAGAVAFGGFALALVANIHDLGSDTGYRPRMLVALVAWPLLTAVPAWLVALGLAAGLGALRRRAP